MKPLRTTTGDTIIEVLLAMAVAVSVLAGAYVLANQAMRLGRQAQERTEANKIAQGQIEALESLAREGKLNEANIPVVGGADIWCLPTWSSLWTTAPTAQKAARNTSPTNVCNRGLYTVSVVLEDTTYLDATKITGGQYRVDITWTGVTRNSAQELAIHYRTYEDIPGTVATPVDPPTPPSSCPSNSFSIGSSIAWVGSTPAARRQIQYNTTATPVLACTYALRMETRDDGHLAHSPACQNTQATCVLPNEWQPHERVFFEGYTALPESNVRRTFRTELTNDIPDDPGHVCEVKIQNITVTAGTNWIVMKHISLWPDTPTPPWPGGPAGTAAAAIPFGNSVHGATIQFASNASGFSTSC